MLLDSANKLGPPLLLQHGLFDSSDDAIMHGREKSPAFFYTDAGYDVWVNNNRGNKYSRRHTTLNPDKDVAFWEFSFDEYSIDIKTAIQYILDTHAQNSNDKPYEKVAVIGQSVGTTQMFIGMSREPEWFENRVSVMIALAPVAKHAS